ncbi:MAG: flagellar basal-body rod protein FlgG [Myxococcota bacterium]|nr:flagellar basal-body rod protein FlgG [Myxococcota bacterium]
MIRALSTAASGMEAQELQIDVIANNIANVNTTAYKKMRGEFQDLLYDNLEAPGKEGADGNQSPTGIQVGQGTRVASTQREFTMGDLNQTNSALDLAIEGRGFFKLQKPDGTFVYSRDGSFKTDSQGRMVNADGLVLDPPMIFPPDVRDVMIAGDGTVRITRANDAESVELGQVELVTFANPAGLEAVGHNRYRQTTASGIPLVGKPGSEGVGRLNQGFLEMSNVKIVEEMIGLIAAQRAYETNSKIIKSADEMLRQTTQIIR